MQHLSADRLAELPDLPPTPEECVHLAACARCATERDAYVALAGMARAERDSMGLPLTRWEHIAGELARDPGAMPDFSGVVAPATIRPIRRAPRWGMQAAAALLLVASGAVFGRMSAGGTPFPERAAATVASRGPVPEVSARLVADSGTFETVEEARAAQARSEQLYEQAAAFLAQHDSTAPVGSPVAYRSRLAALDQVISATREALREAPHDPVINDYYLTTIGQREATLRQLNTALPASLRLDSF